MQDLIKKTIKGIVFKNTASQFFFKILTSGTSFIVTIAIVYFFGVKEFGSFVKVITFISFFYLIVDFGINSVYIKDHFHNSEKNFLNLVLLRVIMSFVMIFIVFVITFFLPYDIKLDRGFSSSEKFLLLVFSLTILTQSLFLSINCFFQKNLLYHLSIIPTILSSLTILIFAVIAIFTKNFLFFFLAYPVQGLVYFFSAYLFIKKRVSLQLRLEGLNVFSKNILVSSLPIGLMLFLNLVYFRADTIILSLFRSSTEVGIYGFSFKMFEFVIALPTFFSNSVYPKLIEKEKKGSDFYKQIEKYSKLLFFLSLFFIASIFIFSPLIELIRPELYPSVAPLRILAFSLPFFFLTSLFQWTFIIKNKKNTLLVIYFVSMVLNVFLNLIFVPSYGYIAAAYITVISEALVFFLMLGMILNWGGFSFKRKAVFTENAAQP